MRELAAVGVVLLGCNASPPPPAPLPAPPPAPAPTSSGDCHDLVRSALQELGKSREGKRACAKDSDCQYVDSNLSCHRGCVASVSRAAVPDLDAARQRVEANQCARFKARGCKVDEAPPCERSLPPECRQGQCY